jgi:hypothetical protein
MPEKTDVLQGTLALMVLKTLDLLGPLHGYGIARFSPAMLPPAIRTLRPSPWESGERRSITTGQEVAE